MGGESGDVQRELEALRARVRELEATEQRLRDVFETLELIVIALDLDADITYANPFTERLSGWTNEELQGKNWFDQFRSGRGSFVSRVRDGEFPSHDQSTIIVRNGDRHQVDWYNVPAARRQRRGHRHPRDRPGHDGRAGRPAVAGGRRAADDGRAGDG